MSVFPPAILFFPIFYLFRAGRVSPQLLVGEKETKNARIGNGFPDDIFAGVPGAQEAKILKETFPRAGARETSSPLN